MSRRSKKKYARNATLCVPVPVKLRDTLVKLVEEGYFATLSEAVRWALVYAYVKRQIHKNKRN